MYYVNPKVSGDQKLTAAADLITIYPNPTGDFININAAEGFFLSQYIICPDKN